MSGEYVKRDEVKQMLCSFCREPECHSMCQVPIVVNRLLSADVVEVVRCKDCIFCSKHRMENGQRKRSSPFCMLFGYPTKANFYCAKGDKPHKPQSKGSCEE